MLTISVSQLSIFWNREEVREITVFDAVKQLELDNFCDLMFGAVKDIGSQEGLKEALQAEITEKALQQINEAALREGHHPLSFSG